MLYITFLKIKIFIFHLDFHCVYLLLADKVFLDMHLNSDYEVILEILKKYKNSFEKNKVLKYSETVMK